MRRQVEVSKPKPKPKPKPFYQRKTKTMKLEVVATPPVGRHRRLANGSSSAGIAPVALTQPTPNSEEPKFVVERFGSSSESRTTTHWLIGRIKILAAIFLLDAAGEESGISTAVRDRVLYQKTSLLVVDALTGVEAESNETGFWKVCKLLKPWWPGTESNRRRQPFQGCALPVTTTQSIVERSIPGTAHFSQVRTSRTPSCSPPQAEVYQSQEANATCRYHVADITSSIRPLYPAAFRTDATPAKESVPCTCDHDQTHIDTSCSSSTGHSASLLVRGRRGGTAGTAGRD